MNENTITTNAEIPLDFLLTVCFFVSIKFVFLIKLDDLDK
jgi:hypothetical protein